MERTLVLIKPDAVERGLIGEIIRRFENRTLRVAAMKLVKPSRELVEHHYEVHRGKEFFEPTVEYMSSGPLVAMVVTGDSAITAVRKMMGALDPLEAVPGTVRGDFTLSTRYNLVHGSDSADTAEREIAIWFEAEEIIE